MKSFDKEKQFKIRVENKFPIKIYTHTLQID